MSIVDRQKGCLYGLAVGDALGAAIEFRKPGSFAPVTCYRGMGPFGLNPGEWTDDTSMALALADSLAKGWNPKDQLKKYCEWLQHGKYSVNGRCFDIGATTKGSLLNFLHSGRTEAYDNRNVSSGNGSIMRLAPLPIAYYDDEILQKLAAPSSRTTHPSQECQDACVYLANLLAALIRGQTREDAMQFAYDKTPDGRIKTMTAGSYKNSPPYIQGSGYVLKSLEAALWAFHDAQSFEEAVLKGVNLGDDSDTTGAVVGQMAGAFWGYSGIPQTLIDGLARKDMIDLYLNPLLKDEK